MPPTLPAPDTLTYEAARDELVALVRRMETGGDSLETTLAMWERAEALASRCQQWLNGARAKFEAATEGSGDDDE